MTLRQRFETLLLFDPNRSPATTNVWISHPSPSEEQALGKLFVVANITGNNRVNLDVINLIQEELRSAYYQSEDTKPKNAFEQALSQTNQRIHQVIADGVGDWIAQANILVAAVWRDTLIISSVGTINAFLLRRSVKENRAVLTMHDINAGGSGAVNPVRLFAHTVSGQLRADDQLLVCTPSLLDYFSVEKLRRTLLENNPTAAIHQWETTLLGVEQQASFGAVIVQTLAIDSVTVPISRPVAQSTATQTAPQVSMENLIAKELATDRLLSPSIWPSIRDVFSQIGQAAAQGIRKYILRKPPRRALPYALTKPGPSSKTPHPWLAIIIRNFALVANWIVSATRALFPRRTSLPSSPSPVSMPSVKRTPWRWSLNRSISWYQKLGARRQLLVVASIVLVLILAVSIFPRATKNSPVATQSSIDAITDHLAKAQAALLYGGDETALQQVNEARTLFNKLPNRSTKDKDAKKAVGASIDDVLTRLAKRTVIASPTLIANLSPLSPDTEPKQLYLTGTRLITIDPERSITTATLLNGTDPSTVLAATLDTGAPQTGVVTGASTILFTTNRGGFIELDTTKETWKPLDSAWPTTKQRIQSLAMYQSRIYALDATNNSIVRFSRSANSLGTGVNWLKESANLSSARGLQVDGSIYVLQSGGLVELYSNGRPSALSLATIEPPLTDATRLWTDVTSTKIYLVDPSHNRIVVFTKAGKLLTQYESSAWANLRDIAINEKTKIAYVLSGTTITSFTLAD